jgi:hypothetical protein
MTVNRTIEQVTLEQEFARAGLASEPLIQSGLVWAPPLIGEKQGAMLFDFSQEIEKRPSRRLAIDFADLSQGDDARILRFARKWGALGIDENGWRKPAPEYECESFASWRLLARRFHGLFRIDAALRDRGRCTDRQDWLDLSAGQDGYHATFAPPWAMKGHCHLTMAGTALEMFLLSAVSQFRVGPQLKWNGSKSRSLNLGAYQGPSNLAGIITMQAITIVAGARGLAFCFGCSRWFTPKRAGQKYCNKKRCKRAAWRESKRKNRRPEEAHT